MLGFTIELAHPDAAIPVYKTEGAAGADLTAVVDSPDKSVTIAPGERAIVSTGIKIALPHGYEAQIRSRSGLAANHGVAVLNSPGTIDHDYRGIIKVILFNSSRENFEVRTGDRIAQMVVAPVLRADFVAGHVDDETERGAGGLGSTGIRDQA